VLRRLSLADAHVDLARPRPRVAAGADPPPRCDRRPYGSRRRARRRRRRPRRGLARELDHACSARSALERR
jgi:hypothetical protein